MSEKIINDVRKGVYLDSVALMRISRAIAELDGVEDAALMSSTPANLQIMTDARLLTDDGAAAGPGDLVIGVRVAHADAAQAALAEIDRSLNRPAVSGGIGAKWNPKSVRSAVRSAPGANLVLISVPGPYAAAEARKSIRRGLHAMIFSDNVSIDDEAALKQEARELGRLVMGPDCGTAIINGTPLAFANRVRRGDVGIVGASGTGMQEVSCLIDRYDGGVSHAIGVGGRDLRNEVGGISTLMAIDVLDADPATSRIVLISKLPSAEIASRVLDRIGASAKPFTICFIGGEPLELPSNAVQVNTLKAAAQAALEVDEEMAADENRPAIQVPAGRTVIRGLFSGGTLCAEAQVVLRLAGETCSSNAPIPGVALAAEMAGGHVLLDLGDDQFTRGKPHPMIEPSVRDQAFAEALAGADTAIILADVVIGQGSSDDPAGHLAAFHKTHSQPGGPAVIASVTGTEADRQVRSSQVAKLEAVGIQVAPTNTDAASWAVAAIQAAG